MGDGTWAHFTPHLAGTVIARKTLPEIAAYGANLLSHLLEQPNNTSDKFAGIHLHLYFLMQVLT